MTDTIPQFDADGLLPPGDYEVTFGELRTSSLVLGPENGSRVPNWDASWRGWLVDHLEMMVTQLWNVGITEIFVDGSFAEDKEHPNDIDGYFVCELNHLASGVLQRELNLQDHRKSGLGILRRENPTRAIPRGSYLCGTFIVLNFTHTSRDSVAASLTSMATSWSFQPPSVARVETDAREALSNLYRNPSRDP